MLEVALDALQDLHERPRGLAAVLGLLLEEGKDPAADVGLDDALRPASLVVRLELPRETSHQDHGGAGDGSVRDVLADLDALPVLRRVERPGGDAEIYGAAGE